MPATGMATVQTSAPCCDTRHVSGETRSPTGWLLHSCSLDSKGKPWGARRFLPGYMPDRSQAALLELPASRSLRTSSQCRALPGTPPVLLASVVQQWMDETLGELGANTNISTELAFWKDLQLGQRMREFHAVSKKLVVAPL